MKFLLINLLFLSSLFASYQKIKIGSIDREYSSQITPSKLREIIDEIEHKMEAQLGVNVFDYSNDGKPIDILYLPPSKAQQRLDKKVESFNTKKAKLDEIQDYFPSKKKEIDSLQNEYNIQADIANTKINNLNKYVKEVNKQKSYPKDEYNKIKSYIADKKSDINYEIKQKRVLESKLSKAVNQYNNKIHSFNNLSRQLVMTANEIENLQRSLKIVRGKTFGQREITLKTTMKDGKVTKQREESLTMDKIEIYSFENLNQLKAVLAHEIGHLVGLPHIEAKDALMNPILQDKQEINLKLTSDDIQNFKMNF